MGETQLLIKSNIFPGRPVGQDSKPFIISIKVKEKTLNHCTVNLFNDGGLLSSVSVAHPVPLFFIPGPDFHLVISLF